MHDRTKVVLQFTVLAIALATAGCGYNQQSRFQMSFLPPAPLGAAHAVEIAEPPSVQPNLYLKDVPAILLTNLAVPQRRTAADETARRADRRYQAGRRAYQSKDLATARREFDTAVDLMLEAAGQDPSDRQEFERKLDEMVDA